MLFGIGELQFLSALIPNKKQKLEGIIQKMQIPKEIVDAKKSKGPRANLEQLQLAAMRPAEQAVWFEHARVSAILGSSSRTLPSVRSGLKCYFGFAGHVMYALAVVYTSVCIQACAKKSLGSRQKLRLC
jgi:hypothetical protein